MHVCQPHRRLHVTDWLTWTLVVLLTACGCYAMFMYNDALLGRTAGLQPFDGAGCCSDGEHPISPFLRRLIVKPPPMYSCKFQRLNPCTRARRRACLITGPDSVHETQARRQMMSTGHRTNSEVLMLASGGDVTNQSNQRPSATLWRYYSMY